MNDDDLRRALEDPYVRENLRRARNNIRKRARTRRNIVRRGERYGRLTVLSYNPLTRYAHAQCDCGEETYRSTTYLFNSLLPSCGCARRSTR